jgi:hypothetical protein
LGQEFQGFIESLGAEVVCDHGLSMENYRVLRVV